MDESNIVKSITPHVCPSCGHDILIEFEMPATRLSTVFTVEQMSAAKAEAVKQIKALQIDEEKKASIIEWIENPSTIFGANEVDKIVESAQQ